MTSRRLLLAFALLAGGAAAQTPPPAAEALPADPAARLETLLSALAQAPKAEAERLQQQIARLWSASGSESMDFLLGRGREAMDGEEYDKAVEHFSALTRLAPGFAEGWNARATAHFLNDELWQAVADIQQTLALEPRHFGALSGLGVILERIGDEAGALRAMRAALRVNPHLDNARDAVERLAPKVDGFDI